MWAAGVEYAEAALAAREEPPGARFVVQKGTVVYTLPNRAAFPLDKDVEVPVAALADREDPERPDMPAWRCPDCGSGVTKVHVGTTGLMPCGKPPGYWTREDTERPDGDSHWATVVIDDAFEPREITEAEAEQLYESGIGVDVERMWIRPGVRDPDQGPEKPERRKAFQAGKSARRSGLGLKQNPFDKEGTHHQQWCEGWLGTERYGSDEGERYVALECT
jgi:hypothetical protein